MFATNGEMFLYQLKGNGCSLMYVRMEEKCIEHGAKMPDGIMSRTALRIHYPDSRLPRAGCRVRTEACSVHV